MSQRSKNVNPKVCVLIEVSPREAIRQEKQMWYNIGKNQTLHKVGMRERPDPKNKPLVEAFNKGKALKPLKG